MVRVRVRVRNRVRVKPSELTNPRIVGLQLVVQLTPSDSHWRIDELLVRSPKMHCIMHQKAYYNSNMFWNHKPETCTCFAVNLATTSGVAWVIGARSGLQFCRPQES